MRQERNRLHKNDVIFGTIARFYAIAKRPDIDHLIDLLANRLRHVLRILLHERRRFAVIPLQSHRIINA